MRKTLYLVLALCVVGEFAADAECMKRGMDDSASKQEVSEETQSATKKVKVNPEIEEWHRKAAQNHADVQYNLGLCFLNGDGVERNAETAKVWFEKAAKQGHAPAQYELCLCSKIDCFKRNKF